MLTLLYPYHVCPIYFGLVLKLTHNTDGIHLKQCVTLYLFTLPFTLISDMGWATIPVVTVVAFTFMGIEGIADEIEMPFGRRLRLNSVQLALTFHPGYDKSDLPLGTPRQMDFSCSNSLPDRYCHDLKEEVQYVFCLIQLGSLTLTSSPVVI